VIGFSKSVDWVDSATFVLALLLHMQSSGIFQESQSPSRNIARLVNTLRRGAYKSLAGSLGLEDEWVVIRILCLLPFLDDPGREIEKIHDLISELRVYAYQLRVVVEAVGHCRCNEALAFLRDLASDKSRAEQFGDAWINAVAAVDNREARDVLLSFVDPELPGMPAEAKE